VRWRNISNPSVRKREETLVPDTSIKGYLRLVHGPTTITSKRSTQRKSYHMNNNKSTRIAQSKGASSLEKARVLTAYQRNGRKWRVRISERTRNVNGNIGIWRGGETMARVRSAATLASGETEKWWCRWT
jgi:hypothetical protein